MIRKLTSLSRKTLLITMILAIAIGIGTYARGHNNKPVKPQYPEYLNFDGNYVFSVPKNYSVDEQSVVGAQLLYSGQIAASTVDDVYNAGGISVQKLIDLTDHSGKAFKNYVNGRYISDLKKNLSTNDVSVKFAKQNGSDVATVTVNKDGQQLRSIYLKGGQRPAVVVTKQNSDAMKTIDTTLIDIETSDLKKESDSIKQAIQNTALLVKGQKAHELYTSASPDLQAKSTEAQLTDALKAAAPYTGGNIVISGVTYTTSDFSAAMRLTKLDKNDQAPAYGLITEKKVDGQWKLQALSLPTPKQ